MNGILQTPTAHQAYKKQKQKELTKLQQRKQNFFNNLTKRE